MRPSVREMLGNIKRMNKNNIFFIIFVFLFYILVDYKIDSRICKFRSFESYVFLVYHKFNKGFNFLDQNRKIQKKGEK
tara:strand:+ start:785 stop:1018 length:234 start_codon:yes stop_codon:yes gene_type:complete